MFTVPTEDQFLSAAAAADFLHVSKKTLEDWRHRGVGPEFVRLGYRSMRYQFGALRSWLAGRTVKSSAVSSATGEER